jgi:nucleoside-triphosphatase
LRRVGELLRAHEVRIAGFLTEELRAGRRRVGFSITALAGGERATLAHVDLPGPPRVGRYGVDLEEFERIALPELQAKADLVLVDELGKMELASSAFCAVVRELFDRKTPLAATVQASRDSFSDALKTRSDVELVRLTRENRDRLPHWIAERLLGLTTQARP